MTISDTLEALAERLQNRFLVWRNTDTREVVGILVTNSGAKDVSWLDHPEQYDAADPRILLAGLMEEIESRGWEWTLKCGEAQGKYTARVYFGKVHLTEHRIGIGDTPALALAEALLAALEGEG